MACNTTWLQSSSFHVYRCGPTLFRRCIHRRSDFRRFHSLTSNGGSFLFRHSGTPVYAQAKRGFSTKDEFASAVNLYFETPLRIVEYPDPVLRAKNKRIDTFDDNLKKLVDEMFDVMYKTDGIGLSAPQVGVNVQLMVFNPVGERGEGEEIVLVNPRVTKYSKKVVLFNEGCLSFPEIYADVKRPESVKIDARDITGAKFAFSLSDLPARIFQHEFDHLQGVLFFDRMTEEVLDSIRMQLEFFIYKYYRRSFYYKLIDCIFFKAGSSIKNLVELEKKYEEKTGLPSPERINTIRGKKVPVGFGK